jgi:SAM-dependent methyltransferase
MKKKWLRCKVRLKNIIINKIIEFQRILFRKSTGTLYCDQNPIYLPENKTAGALKLDWKIKATKEVQIRINSPTGPLLSHSGTSGNVTTGEWVHNGMTFFLQDISDAKELTTANTLSKLSVSVVPYTDNKIPEVGKVNFGDLRRLRPISENWGLDRGLPIDRYYIEKFLSQAGNDIKGHVLEIGDDRYTRMFGNNRVTKTDVLNLMGGDKKTTIVADLTNALHVTSDTFDCIICSQTLQLIYNVKEAIKTLFRILKPGGVLLMTFPGISQTYDKDWRDYWCWNFTALSARQLFNEVFKAENVKITSYGNVFTAISFLQGLSVQDIKKEELDYSDSGFEMVIGVKATKEDCSTCKQKKTEALSY